MGRLRNEARIRAEKKYRQETHEVLTAFLPKGLKEQYKLAAAEHGLSLSKFIQAAVNEFINRHGDNQN